MKKIAYILIFIIIAFAGLALGFFVIDYFFWNQKPTTILNENVVVNENIEAPANVNTEQPPVIEEQPVETPLPDSALLEVPFTSQAPTGNWGMPYQEACEEASLIIVYNFWEKQDLTPATADTQIKEMVAWEMDHFGDYMDTTIEETAEIAEEYYHYHAEVKYDPTAEDIKREIANGNPVIVPAAGRDLGNPNFTAPGPWYHNLVIIGYDGDTFITNDPGTRMGKSYEYSSTTLMTAIHNWVGVKERIREGKKAMLIIKPQD